VVVLEAPQLLRLQTGNNLHAPFAPAVHRGRATLAPHDAAVQYGRCSTMVPPEIQLVKTLRAGLGRNPPPPFDPNQKKTRYFLALHQVTLVIIYLCGFLRYTIRSNGCTVVLSVVLYG
jgi:hypothetical protein